MKIRILFIFLLGIFLLSGCATGLQNLKKNQPQYSLNEKSVVFGGVTLEPGKNYSYTLYLHDVATKKQYELFVAYAALRNRTDFERRSFVVQLPPSEYEISRINFYELSMWGMYTWNVDVKIGFSVPPHSLVYIGNLNYGYEQKHNYFFVKTGKGYLSISDNHEKMTEELRQLYPNLNADVKISLMKLQDTQEQNTSKVRF